MADVRCVFHNRATLGEGVFWSEREQRVYWLDIEGHRVNRFDPLSGANEVAGTGQQVGAAVERKTGGLAVALKDGIYPFDFAEGLGQRLCDPLGGDGESRLNDGKAGPDGRFYVGGMGPEGTQFLFRVERDGRTFTPIEKGVTCSNGLCWSADARSFYYIDSPAKVVWAYDFDVRDGSIRNRRVVVDVRDESCVPDGMTIDAEGMLWVAFWEGWVVRRYDPNTGIALQEIRLPVARVTTCAFGGPDLRDLYITTASVGFKESDWEREPLAGGLFVCRPGVAGRRGSLFG